MIFCVFFIVFQIFFKILCLNIFINLSILTIQSFTICNLIESNKTPLKYTPRLIRLYSISALFLFICLFTPFPVGLSSLLVYIIPPFSNAINLYDKIKNKKFINNASSKIKNSQTKIIAITGSNGKTSVKNILLKMLSSTYKVLATPESFNTPIGIAKFINESDLTNVKFLILEYGARQQEDIKKLCKTFGAEYGIITTIAPQHLETFKNINTIKNTKNELAEYLNKNLCIYNLDNQHCKELFLNKQGQKFGISILEDNPYSASNIIIKNFKTHFVLKLNKNKYECYTNLLGSHNIINIVLASALAHRLGVEDDKIIKSIKELNQVPHRLELIKTHINILDDTYNCSLASAEEALKVLNSIDGKKMVATPGIIEAGKQESSINFKLGTLCSFCDYVVIIGNQNKTAIYNGLKHMNYPDKKICLAKNLDEAKQYFHLLSFNDNLLLLNDLPDEYN